MDDTISHSKLSYRIGVMFAEFTPVFKMLESLRENIKIEKMQELDEIIKFLEKYEDNLMHDTFFNDIYE